MGHAMELYRKWAIDTSAGRMRLVRALAGAYKWMMAVRIVEMNGVASNLVHIWLSSPCDYETHRAEGAMRKPEAIIVQVLVESGVSR